MSIIREMRQEDADAVRQVEATTSSAWWKQLNWETAELPQRTRVNVLACWEKDPQGCFVAEEEGRVVGFIFSRTWGGVGWLGTFAVLPEHQGYGIGKQLIAASLEYLQRDFERVVGLETMSESPYNLGLYLRLRQGFQVRFPTLLLSKTLRQTAVDGPDLPRWSRANKRTRECWLADLREATGQIRPGLDYSKEITSISWHGLGETLVLTDGDRATGMSIVWLVNSRGGLGQEGASVQILALHPTHTHEKAFHALLESSEALACAHGKRVLTVPVNTRHPWALERLLYWGYRVEQAMVRMVLKGTDKGPATDSCVNLSRWAG